MDAPLGISSKKEPMSTNIGENHKIICIIFLGTDSSSTDPHKHTRTLSIKWKTFKQIHGYEKGKY